MIHDFPYTDFHELNLDWLMKEISKLSKEMSDFKLVNQLYYQGIWSIAKSYPKYSIVVDSNNMGYISLQPVPAGVDISNTDYWMAIGTINAALPDQSMMKKKITSDTNVILIGNSYAAGTGGGGHGWAYWLKQHTGCNEVAYAYQNGGDFIATGNANATYPNKTYYQACQSITASLTQEQRENVDFIIFGGGYNDYTDNINSLPSSATIRNAIYTVIDYLKPLYPNAEIVLIPLCPTTYKSSSAVTDGYSYDQVQKYVSAWVRGAAGRGCLSTSHSKEWFSGRYATYGSGNIHLNEDGYNLAAYYMEAIINGWDGTLRYDLDHTLTFTAAVTNHTYTDSGTGNDMSTIHVWSEDGLTHIHGHVDYDAGTALSASNQPELFSFDSVFAPPQAAVYLPVFCYTTNDRVIGLIRITTGGSVGLRWLSDTTIPTSGSVYIDATYEA